MKARVVGIADRVVISADLGDLLCPQRQRQPHDDFETGDMIRNAPWAGLLPTPGALTASPAFCPSRPNVDQIGNRDCVGVRSVSRSLVLVRSYTSASERAAAETPRSASTRLAVDRNRDESPCERAISIAPSSTAMSTRAVSTGVPAKTSCSLSRPHVSTSTSQTSLASKKR